ncbi:hypothetical protein HMPREF9554_00997 [Treponema phagedenis F0421]|nr:hypothetical protein HMPREF9554_00997 [Treponema phagedenis F0421]
MQSFKTRRVGFDMDVKPTRCVGLFCIKFFMICIIKVSCI